MAVIGLQKGSGKKVESQGKVSEKSGNFDMENEWQPCYPTAYLHLCFCICKKQVFS